MISRHLPRSVDCLQRAYRCLLQLYPESFRRQFGREMHLAFVAEARDLHKRAGALALLPFLVRITMDSFASAGKEHLDMPQRLLIVPTILILLAVDWLTFHDLFEPHTVRDYLTLAASLLVFVSIGSDLWLRHRLARR